jgi:hypothetical protein
MSTIENQNRHWIDPTATASNQNNTSSRLGINVDNAAARPLNDITAPSVLPGGGKSMRVTPTGHRGGK